MTIADGPPSVSLSLFQYYHSFGFALEFAYFGIQYNFECSVQMHSLCTIHYQRIHFGMKSSIIGVIKTRHAICFGT